MSPCRRLLLSRPLPFLPGVEYSPINSFADSAAAGASTVRPSASTRAACNCPAAAARYSSVASPCSGVNLTANPSGAPISLNCRGPVRSSLYFGWPGNGHYQLAALDLRLRYRFSAASKRYLPAMSSIVLTRQLGPVSRPVCFRRAYSPKRVGISSPPSDDAETFVSITKPSFFSGIIATIELNPSMLPPCWTTFRPFHSCRNQPKP